MWEQEQEKERYERREIGGGGHDEAPNNPSSSFVTPLFVCIVAQVWPHRPIAFDFDSLRLRLTKEDLQARIIAELNNHYTTTCTPPEVPGVRWVLQSVCVGAR